VRVGRAAIDAEAIRLIEAHHPQIRFDWPQILNGEEEAIPPEPPAPPPRRAEREGPPAAAAAPSRPAEPVASAPDEPPGPALARLGSEGLTRLRARHADVLASIDRRTQDEHRRQQLYEQAARLNPDNWCTDADVARALEDYETVLASLRDAVGRRRRRKRPRAGGPGGPEAGEGPASPDGNPGPPEDDADED
jgi:hypothetical protein